jgi:Domain of unknown function (DUF1707)
MSDANAEVAGAEDGRGQTTRVGNAERERAIALLGENWRAGRLDPAEHERRVTKAKSAVTRADLDALFADLPRAGAAQESAGGAAASGAAGFLQGKRDTIMALTPFAALLVFFITGTWLWFLMVPVMGILLYGPGGKKNTRQPER